MLLITCIQVWKEYHNCEIGHAMLILLRIQQVWNKDLKNRTLTITVYILL